MRAKQVASGLAFCLMWAVAAAAQPAPVDPEAVAGVIKTLQNSGTSEAPTLYQNNNGYLRFLGAPPDGYFVSSTTGQKSVTPEAGATAFLTENAAAFTPVAADGFVQQSVKPFRNSSYVRFGQEYGGVPVYGAGAVVQTDDEGRVFNVMSDVLVDTTALDSGDVSLDPTISSDAAEVTAKQETADRYEGVVPAHLNRTHPPILEIYDPKVLSLEGDVRLVWRFEFAAVVPLVLREVAIIDAHTGEAVSLFTKVANVLNRDVRDSANTGLYPDETARGEDDDPVGITDVDEAFDFLGDTYDFYLNEHNYDSFDNSGSTMIAYVRLPFYGASWNGIFSQYGTGLAVDDVVAHEVTHGVTEFSSGLIYQGFSGAINESFSDMWGEFVDLTNGAGNDSEAVRWFLGEDIAIEGTGEFNGTQGGTKRVDLQREVLKQTDDDLPPTAIRYMADPTVYGDPDRLGSPLLFNPNSIFDNGGVHINSGIGNKLCYLLVDGDTFNGETVQPMGISRTADLFFATQFLLTPAADYNDLYLAMSAASVELGMSFSERLNVAAAGRAVEIVPEDLATTGLRAFRATPSQTLEGDPVIALTWTNPEADDFRNVQIVRSLGDFVSTPDEGVEIYAGTDEQFLDVAVVAGTTYYYTIIADFTESFPQVGYARAVAGESPATILSEGFSSVTSPANPMDLSFTQLTFVPVGAPVGTLGSVAPGAGYDTYEVTQRQAFSFPVARDDVDGGSFRIPLTDDGVYAFSLGSTVFPFFGENYNQVYVSSNGYIGFTSVDNYDLLNFPSLESHFEIPRISFLFTDLAANSGGQMWLRSMDDRLVVTIEDIPEFPRSFSDLGSAPNSVQVELFINGQIRFTYGELSTDIAFVGISDGRGVPPILSQLFPGVIDSSNYADFSEAPEAPTRLHLEPVARPIVSGGDTVEFEVQAVGGADNPADIQMFGAWDGAGEPPFAQVDGDTGRFRWEIPIDTSGIFTLRVTAVQGDERAFQDIRIYVGATIQDPVANNLTISTATPFEDPSVDRTVDVTRPLIAGYTYFHPNAATDPVSYAEGNTILWWYRNGEIVPAYTNSMSVPAGATRAGDVWYFSIIPVTATFLVGEEVISPKVTITALPTIDQVVPAFGLTTGGEEVTITGTRLGTPVRILFGGVEVPSFTSLGDGAIVLTTPVHNPGTVDIVIETPTGSSVAPASFNYVNSLADIPLADVNVDGQINAVDIQLVVEAVLELNKSTADDRMKADTNGDGEVNAADVQTVVNEALLR